jgi:hypothetical protein
MPTIAFRVSQTLFDKVQETAKKRGIKTSDLLRETIEENMRSSATEDWEVVAWNIFEISADQFKYAFRNARSCEEFFSSIGKWAKRLNLKIYRFQGQIGLSINYQGKPIHIYRPQELPKIENIAGFINELDKRIQEINVSFTKEFANVRQSDNTESSTGDGGEVIENKEGNGN